jgi:hypothetical protein
MSGSANPSTTQGPPDPFSFPLAIKLITPDSSPASVPAEKTSPLDKVIGGVKNALKGGKEKEESSPALQEAVRKMEERKAETVAEMQAQGKDTKALSGRKRDQVEFAPGEGFRGF